jgi:hypothetical protein
VLIPFAVGDSFASLGLYLFWALFLGPDWLIKSAASSRPIRSSLVIGNARSQAILSGCKPPSVRFQPLVKGAGRYLAKRTVAVAVPRFFQFDRLVKIPSGPSACLEPNSSRDADFTFLPGNAMLRFRGLGNTISLGKLA